MSSCKAEAYSAASLSYVSLWLVRLASGSFFGGRCITSFFQVIQCGRHNDIFKFWLQWRSRVSLFCFTKKNIIFWKGGGVEGRVRDNSKGLGWHGNRMLLLGLFKTVLFSRTYRVSHERWQLVNSLKCLLP